MSRTNEDAGKLTVSGVRGLVPLLGVSKSKAAELAKEPWFPKKGPDGTWSVAEVRRAVEEQGKAAPSSAGDLSPEERELVQVMSTSHDKIALAKAAMELAARRLARAHESGDARAVGKMTTDLARALEELRRQEADHLELEKARGQLIDRDVAKVVMAAFATETNNTFERAEARIAAQVEIWLADSIFREAAPEERARRARAWFGGMSHAIRLEASSPEARRALEERAQRMIQAEIADRAGART